MFNILKIYKNHKRYEKLRGWCSSNVVEGWEKVENYASICTYVSWDDADNYLDGLDHCNIGLMEKV